MKIAEIVGWIENKCTKTKNTIVGWKEWVTHDGSLLGQGMALILDLNLILGILPVMVQTVLIMAIESSVQKWLFKWYQWNKWLVILAIRKWCGKALVYVWNKGRRRRGEMENLQNQPAKNKKQEIWIALCGLWEMGFRDRPTAMAEQRVFFRFEK